MAGTVPVPTRIQPRGHTPAFNDTSSIFGDNHIKKGQNLAANSPSPTQEMNLNLSASLNVFKLLANPSLCLPHAIVPTFKDLPIPLDSAFKSAGAKVEIKAIVLDKDDCFAVPETSEVYKPYQVC